VDPISQGGVQDPGLVIFFFMTVVTIPPCFEDIIELALPDGDLLASEDTDIYTSKLGGRPVWLNTPSKEFIDSLKCPKCGTDLFLLLQMDCPREEFPAVDRILYLFACNTRLCSQDPSGWRVIFMTKRIKKDTEVSQAAPKSFWDSLMNENESNEEKESPASSSSLQSQKQQSQKPIAWSNMKNKFPGIYLHIDEEIIVEKKQREKKAPVEISAEGLDTNDEQWKGEEYEKFRVPGTDKSFSKFQKRIAHYPRQCVRYAVSGGQSPLLYHDMNLDGEEIEKLCKPCQNSSCRSKQHRFELQLMPAILAFLPTEASAYISHIPTEKRSKNPLISDGMEWATVLVYSCAEFCGFKDGLHEETSEGSVIIQLEPSSPLVNNQ
jgi:pre-rRNA-processing protein TSR4